MPAHSLEIINEIARRPGAMHRAQFFGICFAMKMPGSAADGVPHDGRLRCVGASRRKATHTDPQILFLQAAS